MAETKKKTVKAAPQKAAEEKKAEVKTDATKTEAPVKKAEKKVEAKVEKPAVKEASAFARDIRVTPRKIRLVVDLVRGKNVSAALGILARVNRSASAPVIKLIKSASANATNNFGLSAEKLYIAEIQAADGIRMKRSEPRGKGSSSPIIRRCANIRILIKERE
jgi:large subunit ribosomal protein L22